jgi:hypothetical protein
MCVLINTGAAQAAPPVALSGAYVGWGGSSNVNTFSTWRGSSATVALDYLGYSNWSDVDNVSSMMSEWKPFQAAGGKLVLSVPMLVQSTSGTFAAGAAGAYDQYFESLGKQLVAGGFGSIVLRMGWEFNVSSSVWAVQPGSSTDGPAEYVAYWRHLVDLFRAIPGSHFKFDWTVNDGYCQWDPAEAYPGNDYVDYVGVDIYDVGWAADGGPITDNAQRFGQLTDVQYGLNWWAAFAKAHGKRITLPEWGLAASDANGGGDDPYFIQAMHAWMVRNHPAYEMYFNDDASVIDSASSPQTYAATQTYPEAAAEYQQLWGDSTGPVASAARVAKNVKASSGGARHAIVRTAKKRAAKKAAEKKARRAAAKRRFTKLHRHVA